MGASCEISYTPIASAALPLDYRGEVMSSLREADPIAGENSRSQIGTRETLVAGLPDEFGNWALSAA